MIIDFHTHIYPERVAAKILPAAKKKLKVEVPGTGAPDDLRRHMSDSGISRSVLLPLARGREDVSSLNDWILSVSGEGLIPFGAVHPFMVLKNNFRHWIRKFNIYKNIISNFTMRLDHLHFQITQAAWFGQYF